MAVLKKVLVAGATGYLGRFLLRELKKQEYWVRALSRDSARIEDIEEYVDDLFTGQVTDPGSLKGLCRDIDIVVSTLGITRQKDGLTYMDVDYQGNRNILEQALLEGVGRFMYISVLNADKLHRLQIVKAKERFADELKASGLESIIIRPNGFFSDMEEFFRMAQSGRAWLFGKGTYRANPIHGADLAEFCVKHLDSRSGEYDVGGPEVLAQDEIARLAFAALGRKSKISRIPLWARDGVLRLARAFSSSKTYGPLEFFMTVLAMDMVAPKYGNRTIGDHFRKLAEESG